MIEISHGEALDLHLKGEPVWVMVPFDDKFQISTIRACRCFKDEAVALKEKVDELIEQADPGSKPEPVPKETPKRAPKGTRPKQTAVKTDHGKIVSLYRCHLKQKNWPVPKIASELGVSEATVYNHIKMAKEKGEL